MKKIVFMLIFAALCANVYATKLSNADDVSAVNTKVTTISTNVDSILADTGTDGVVLGADAITAAKIATDAIGAAELAADCITTAEIANGAITTTELATDCISSDEIAATAVAEIAASGLFGSSNPSSTNANYIAVPSITFDTTGTWSTVASHEILTVTGMVRVRILAVCTSTLTDAGNGATLTLGTEGSAANIIASTDTDDLLSTEFWNDATPTVLEADATSTTMLDFVVMGGKDIGYTIGTEALTGGTIEFHVWWTPLSVGATVAVGAGGTL